MKLLNFTESHEKAKMVDLHLTKYIVWTGLFGMF